MSNTIQWSDLYTLLAVIALLAGGFWRAAALIGSLRQDIANQSQQSRAEINAIRHELTQYKVEVAEKYVSAQSMRDLEERLINSIDRLGDRFDRVFEKSA